MSSDDVGLRRTLVASLVLASGILLPRCAEGDAPTQDRFAGLDAYVQAALQKWEVPGLTIVVVKDGKTVLSRQFGECEIGSGRKVDSQTLFPIASVSKTITAAALALLVDEGKLRWDDPIRKHLPEWELSDPYLTQHCTVRDLLCHRSGLPRADLLQDGTGFDAQEVLRRLKFLEPAAQFRTRLIYNNHTYTVLDELVERVSGQAFQRFIDERLFQPLGIKLATKLPRDRVALRHWRSDNGIVSRPPLQTDGFRLTARDLAKWLRLHLSEGAFDSRQLIAAESVREMQALQMSVPVRLRPKNNVYAAQFYGAGLGWFVQDYRGRKVVLHTGSWGAVAAMMPEENLGVVVLANLDLETLPSLLMYDVFDAYLDRPGHVWDEQKWAATWLKHEPPGQAYLPRDLARTRLEKMRSADTKPSLPLSQYAGCYESPLYGALTVREAGGQLVVAFGEHETVMSHWENESFYVRSPTRLTFDWLVRFELKDGTVGSATVVHVGWDNDEKDHAFGRIK